MARKKKIFLIVGAISLFSILIININSIICAIIGHRWKEADCTSPQKCSICGETIGAKKEHNYSGGSCTTKETCTLCGVEGNFKHNVEITLCGLVHCRDCGGIVGFKEHKYNSNGVCKYCGEKENTSSGGKTSNWKTVPTSDNDYAYALTAAQDLVKEKLKSPSTAKFPWDNSDYTVKRSGSDWKVSGYVDAQNGFGATIRATWTAYFTMGDTSGSTYKISNYSVTITE